MFQNKLRIHRSETLHVNGIYKKIYKNRKNTVCLAALRRYYPIDLRPGVDFRFCKESSLFDSESDFVGENERFIVQCPTGVPTRSSPSFFLLNLDQIFSIILEN